MRATHTLKSSILIVSSSLTLEPEVCRGLAVREEARCSTRGRLEGPGESTDDIGRFSSEMIPCACSMSSFHVSDIPASKKREPHTLTFGTITKSECKVRFFQTIHILAFERFHRHKVPLVIT
jgi:hypothetical protein